MTTGKFSDIDQDPDYRAFFARRWQQFCTENFDTAAQLREAFDRTIDRSTAENWMAGHNGPQGWAVGKALKNPKLRDSVLKHIAAE